MNSEAIKILRRLQQFGYKTSIIAGGAVRDEYLDQEITDFDIFLWDPRHSQEFDTIHNPNPTKPQLDFDKDSFELEQTSWFAAILGLDTINQIFQHGGYTGPVTGDGQPISTTGIGAQLTSIWEFTTEFNKYQLIYTHCEPKLHVDRHFDFGLCKAYCDGEKIRYTPDFLRDVKQESFTIVAEALSGEQFAYAIDHHLPKMKKKYPRYNLAVAPHNIRLYNDYLISNRKP